jgi:hypothetical protein
LRAAQHLATQRCIGEETCKRLFLPHFGLQPARPQADNMPYKGGKRKKRRTHKVLPPGAEKDKTPKCIVLRRGNVSL